MQRNRVTLSAFGTTGVLLAASLTMLAVVSALVTFDAWPTRPGGAIASDVAVHRAPAARVVRAVLHPRGSAAGTTAVSGGAAGGTSLASAGAGAGSGALAAAGGGAGGAPGSIGGSGGYGGGPQGPSVPIGPDPQVPYLPPGEDPGSPLPTDPPNEIVRSAVCGGSAKALVIADGPGSSVSSAAGC